MTGQEIGAELKVHPDVMKIALREAGVEVLRGRNPKDYSEKEKAKIVKAVELITASWKYPKVAKKEKAVEKPEPKKEKVEKKAKKEEKKIVAKVKKSEPAKKPAKPIVEDDDVDEAEAPVKADPKKKLLNTKPPVDEDDDFEDEEDEMEEDDGEDDDFEDEEDDE